MDSFVARQPIFSRDRGVYGYELLFRSGIENFAVVSDGDAASRQVVADSFGVLGIDTLVQGKRAFINVTRDLLVDDWVTFLPPDGVVIEILEDVVPDDEVLRACRRLRAAGYLLAMDDFTYTECENPLTRYAGLIKVDMLKTQPWQRAAMVERFCPLGIQLVAEKVETHEAFTEALNMGFDYFQGYFFARPVVMSARRPPTMRSHCLEILREIHRPFPDFDRLEELIKREVSIAYGLMRYINSAFFGLRHRIHSVRHALNLIGEVEVRRWLSLITMADMGGEKPAELMIQATVRARMCELLASLAGTPDRGEELFLTGLFSLLDAILDQPLAELLRALALDTEIERALSGDQNRFRDVLDLVIAYERAEWDRLPAFSAGLPADERSLPALYREAVVWAQEGPAQTTRG